MLQSIACKADDVQRARELVIAMLLATVRLFLLIKSDTCPFLSKTESKLFLFFHLFCIKVKVSKAESKLCCAAAAGRPRLFSDGPTMWNALTTMVGYLNSDGYCYNDKCHVRASTYTLHLPISRGIDVLHVLMPSLLHATP